MSKPFFLICFLFGLFSFRTIRGQDITLNRDHASLQELLQQIHDQTGYFFFYSNNDLAEAKPVWIHVSKAPLEEVLAICFAGQPLVYRIDNKTITVQKKPAASKIPVDVKGKVLTEQGDPLEDASVEIAVTHRAVSTNSDGEFSFEKVPEESVLVFSHVGYQSQTITLSKNLNLTVILKRSASRLDEVQVIAYGSTTRRLNTGNVSGITRETLEQQPVANPLEAMEGRLPGVFISQQTGMPGGAIKVQIRGQNSLRSDGNYPLYVIDGVPYTSISISSYYTSNSTFGGNPLNEINPADIERIDILKDADATAIYGSRGANGVMLITTKKGLPGKSKGTINAATGYNEVGHMLSLLNTRQYLDMRYEAFFNDAVAPGPSDFDLNQWDTTSYTNWEKTLLGGSAGIQDLDASLSGGSANFQYLIGSGFHGQGTVFPGNLYDQRTSFHVYLNQYSNNKKFRLTLNTNYLYDNNQLSTTDLTSNALSLPPDAPAAHDADGNLNWGPGYFDNPYAYLMQHYSSQTNNLLGNLQISYTFFDHLQLKLSGGYNLLQSHEKTAVPVASNNPLLGVTTGDAVFSDNAIKSWILEPQIVYDQSLKKLSIQALAGATIQENISQGQSFYADGYTSDLLLGSLAGASSIQLLEAPYSQYRYEAIFARLGLRWKNQYLINLTGRRDGSSRFGPGNQLANFGALGLGWIFSKTKLIADHFPVLSFGKLRASYGSTGSDQIGDYGYLSSFSPTIYPYQGVNGLYPANLFNADYSWEINRKMEFGLDLGFWNDRLLLNASVYRNRSSNQLVGLPLPLITGFASIQANSPATVQNQGLELEINSLNIQAGRFVWKTAINLTIPKNKLLVYPNLKGSSYANLYSVGKSLGDHKAFQAAGLDPETGVYQYFSVLQGAATDNPSYPGDLASFESVKQDYYGGLVNEFQFGSIQLSFFFQFVHQTGFNYISGSFQMPGTLIGNQPRDVLNRWQKPGDQKTFQKFSQDYGSQAYLSFSNLASSDAGVSDASFIRLKNISLSWLLPSHWMNAIHLEQTRLFFRGQNLLTITHYRGLDPESQSTRMLPPLRTLELGIQCSL